MSVLLVSRHIPSDFQGSEREQRAQEILTSMGQSADQLGLNRTPSSRRIVLSSPARRAVETAMFFADKIGAELKTSEAFGENIMPERAGDTREGVDLLKAKLETHDLVWLVTHQPLVSEFFGRVAGSILKTQNEWVSTVELFYGIHAVNLDTKIVVSWGHVR